MTDADSSQQVERLAVGPERIEQLCLLIVAAIGVVVLTAWWMPWLGARLPGGWSVMKANTSLGMLLAAASLGLSGRVPSAVRRYWGKALGACVLLLAAFTLFEYMRGTTLGLDTWLAEDPTAPLPGRMSPQTAAGLLMVGLCALIVDRHRGPLARFTDLLAVCIATFVLTLAAGYMYGALQIVGASAAVRVSPQTLLCFALLGLVICSRRTVSGPLEVLRGRSMGSRIARITLPLAVLLPFVLASARVYATSTGILGAAAATALALALLCLSAAGLVLVMAWHINRLEKQVLDRSLYRSRQELQESEQRYGELVDQALEGITVRKPTGEFLFVNDSFCRMLGYTRAELLQMNIREVVHPEDAETIAQVQRLQGGNSLHLAKRMRRKDGGIAHVEVSVRRLRDGSFQSTIQDVSEHKLSEERFKAMVEGSPTAMLIDRKSVV